MLCFKLVRHFLTPKAEVEWRKSDLPLCCLGFFSTLEPVAKVQVGTVPYFRDRQTRTSVKTRHTWKLQTGGMDSPVLDGFGGGRGSQFGHKDSHDVEEENKVYLSKGNTSSNHFWKLCYRAVHLHTISCCRHINNEWEGARNKTELLFKTGRRLMGSEAANTTLRPTLQRTVSPSGCM